MFASVRILLQRCLEYTVLGMDLGYSKLRKRTIRICAGNVDLRKEEWKERRTRYRKRKEPL